MAVNIYAKVFLLLFSCFIARNRTCSTNNNLNFSNCESGGYHINSLYRRIVQRYKIQFVKMAKSVADCR